MTPPVGGARRFLVTQWRTLCRMRTAVLLLAVVAGLSIIASMLPQKAIQPVRATGWVQSHQTIGPLFDNLGLFSVYESWWLLVVAALMYVSLTHCVWTRGRAVVRRWRRGLPRGTQMMGEIGSLVFHLSFFVLLFGIVYGKVMGFTAYANVIEGQSVIEARPSYDQVEEGLLFRQQDHRGFEVKVDSFKATYFADGRPSDFVTHTEVLEQGRRVDEQDVRVNQYLQHDNVKFYQANYGWAPVVRVRAPDGRTVFNSPIVFFGTPSLANGVLKVPAAGPPPEQLGALMFMVPDPRPDTAGTVRPGGSSAVDPILFIRLFKGDLRAERAQNVYELDTSRMAQVWTGNVSLGETVAMPGGFQLSFDRLPQYSGLQITQDPGLPIIWFSFVLMLGGLMVRLYLRPVLEWRSRRGLSSAGMGVGSAETGESRAPPLPEPASVP